MITDIFIYFFKFKSICQNTLVSFCFVMFNDPKHVRISSKALSGWNKLWMKLLQGRDAFKL